MRWTVGLVAMACTTALGAQAPTGTVDGWKLVVRNTIDSGGVDHRHWTTSTMWVAGHLARTEVTEPRPSAAVAAFGPPISIVDDSAHTMTVMFDHTRNATTTPFPLVPASRLRGDTTSYFITAPTMTMHDLGAGEPILGHPTHKYSVAISYVSQQPLMGLPCKRTIRTEETIWAATDLQREENLRQYVRDSRPATGVDLGPVMDSLQQLRLHRERLINGLILRSAVALTKPASGAAENPVTTTMEVVELTHGPIPRSMFAVPADYTITPPRPRPSGAAATPLAARRPMTARDSTIRAKVRAAVCDPGPDK